VTALRARDGVGASARRVDGEPKVRGEYAYAGDLSAPEMLFGATVRSPHASARILSIDTAAAKAAPGVAAVLTAADVPGSPTFGLEFSDQPVLAGDVVRYEGEPVAIVAAETLRQARAAAALVLVDYAPLPVVADMEQALEPDAPSVHPFGNVLRHVHVEDGDVDAAEADVWVERYVETAMQDQAALGPEGGLAVPAGDGGVEIWAASQWLHVDRRQIAAALDLPEEKVRVSLAGVGGAFGSREDIHVQIHASLLALATGRPVKMGYGREESFHGHVHRHPARAWVRYGATFAGDLVACEVRLLLDGGAYASSSPAVLGNAATFAAGPYEVPNVRIEATVVYSNNPPCGAMRGFGAPQVCFAYETAMDALAEEIGLDPLELRLRNAVAHGSRLPTGQVLRGAAPVRELIERCRALPLPPPGDPGLRRGVGYAVGFKNVAYSEGFDDASAATVTLAEGPEGPVATIRTAAVDYGQGLYTVLAQIARTELDVDEVVVLPASTDGIGSSGSTSASRQTTMTGGAVRMACIAVREELDARLGDLSEPVTCTREFHHRPTTGMDARGHGEIHVSFGFTCQRAVVDLDPELGTVRVVELAVAQDVGRLINPQGAEGQVEGGAAQGLGLALMEAVQVEDGIVRNPSFTDYLIPTFLDVPRIRAVFVEEPEPGAPYGVKGIGEVPTIAAGPAVVAALRAASGVPLNRMPVLPDDLVGLRGPAPTEGPARVPDVPGQQPVPEYLGLGLGQHELMKGQS
jgi:CO/xanthine dehydrogenase Mo-binding subunit